MSSKQNIILGLGGGCHWCTEAIFSSLSGILDVQSGWLSSNPPADCFSEGIRLEVDENVISLKDIISIHVETHSSDSNHSKRHKYRSAIYVLNKKDKCRVLEIISQISEVIGKTTITQVLDLKEFKPQTEAHYVDYYYKQPEKPFCKTYINPKLKKLLKLHGKHITEDKLPIIKELLGVTG
jgi:peptide-methionine (S)-S-oxide reductase